MSEKRMEIWEVIARMVAYIAVVYGIMWFAGIEVRSPQNRAADVFLAATAPGEKLLAEERIKVRAVGDIKVVAWVEHTQHDTFRPMNVSCEFYPDGSIEDHSETAVTLRYASQVWAYDVTFRIDEEITRCQHFETAARNVIEEVVARGSWRAIPTFNYDKPPHWFWRRGLYLSPNIFGKTEPDAG